MSALGIADAPIGPQSSFGFFFAIQQLTGRRRDILSLEGIPAEGELRGFVHQDVLGNTVRWAAWLCGLVRPVGADFVTLFSEPANGVGWLDDIQVFSGFDGRYRPISQSLHHLAVLLGGRVTCHSFVLTLVLPSVYLLWRCSNTARAIFSAALRASSSLIIRLITVRPL